MKNGSQPKNAAMGPKSGHGIRGRWSKYFMPRTKQPHFLLSVVITTCKLFVIFLVILGFAGFGALLGVAKAYVDGTPALDLRRIDDQSLTSFIYDRYGNLSTEYRGLEHRIWASLDEIPQVLKDAVIATEDVRFFAHNGIDYKRLLGAFINNLRNESVQGGSTLTQQLIKLTHVGMEQTYRRKLQEAYLAIQLERKYSKYEILEAYLNTIYLGSGNYGVKAAAQNYFEKELEDLTLREAAMLVGTIQNGVRFDPRMNYFHWGRPELPFRRANIVLRLMYENGFISKAEYDNALFRPDENGEYLLENYEGFTIVEKSSHQRLYDHPYFIEYVVKELRQSLMELYNWSGREGEQAAMNLIHTGGLHIYTTLDPEIQSTVEAAVYDYDNYPDMLRSDHRVQLGIQQPQVGAVVLDNETAELRGIVGGRSEPEARFWTNRANILFGSPGSGMKALGAFAPFIEAGYPGGIIIEDVPVPMENWRIDGEPGFPANYTGVPYRGPVTMRYAITNSLNYSAARIVAERIGINYASNKIQEMGITANGYASDPQASNLTLGANPVNLIELTGAFATIANRGIYREPTSIVRVLDRDGNEIINNADRVQRKVFAESTAFIITDLLSDAASSSGTGGGARFRNMSIAGKTGTGQEHRSAFFGGFTPYYTAVVMIAPDQPASMRGSATGGRFAAPLWRRFMEPIHQDLPNIPFFESIPEGVVRATVCALSGKLPTDNCVTTVTEFFPRDAVPKDDCDMHQALMVCAYSGKLPGPFCPPEHHISRPVVVLPENSVYQLLTDEELAGYPMLAGAFRQPVDPRAYDYNNPGHRELFCHLHTQAWYEAEQQRPELTALASQLINQVKMIMQQYDNLLNNNQKKTLQDAIQRLQDALAVGLMAPPAPDEPAPAELPHFNPSLVKDEMEKLRKVYFDIFDAREPPPDDDDDNDASNRRRWRF